MKKLILLFLFSHLIGLNIVAQNSEEIIKWSSERKLTWEDFQGIPPLNTLGNILAINAGEINYDMEKIDYTFVKVMVRNVFIKKLSWSKSEDFILLKHEQLHFDIREVYTRKIRQEIKSITYSSINDLNSKVNEIYNRWDSINDKMEDSYDYETEHSINEEKQKEWNEKIAKQLEELKEYSNPEIIIEIKK